MEDGHWLTPFLYGQRFQERPVLLSWVAAQFGELTGSVTLWSLRIPHLIFFLAGALLIYNLLRTATGKSAAIFGALCWISMPMVAPKFINAEPDVVVSTLLFAGFVIWWLGSSSNRMTLLKWISVCVLISLAGLTKGPQPVAFFTLGVGAYILIKRREQIPAFLATNVAAAVIIGSWYVAVYQPNDVDAWLVHSRVMTTTGFRLILDHMNFTISMLAEVLPGTILIVPAMFLIRQGWKSGERDLMLAAVLYATICTLVLVFWPGGVATRYAMPGTMALAVVCGLMFEEWRCSHAKVIISSLTVTYLIFGAFLARGWVAMPFWPNLFQESRFAGDAIAAAVGRQLGPLYIIGSSSEFNMLVYVSGPIRSVTLNNLGRLDKRAVAVLHPDEEAALARANPTLHLVDGADIISQRMPYRIVEISPSRNEKSDTNSFVAR
jgi:4-amino-4-deoxy-L-arabinose transferase-like glycosyltransferase